VRARLVGVEAEVAKVGQPQQSGMAKVRALLGGVLGRPIAQVMSHSEGLRNRYGPRYSSAMLVAAFFAFFLPFPGSSWLGIALVVVVAEAHRAVSRRRGSPGASPDLLVVGKETVLQSVDGPVDLVATLKGAPGTWRRDFIHGNPL
jgi:hypothetical protein